MVISGCMLLVICTHANQAKESGYAFSTLMANAKQYVELQKEQEKKLPKLKPEADAQEVAAHRAALAELIRASRADAKPGNIFDPRAIQEIKREIREEFKGAQAQRLRATIMEEKTTGIPLRVNHPYPESKALSMVPPTILLKLPQLPKELQYRFVGRHLTLMDEKANLIVDFIPNVVP